MVRKEVQFRAPSAPAGRKGLHPQNKLPAEPVVLITFRERPRGGQRENARFTSAGERLRGDAVDVHDAIPPSASVRAGKRARAWSALMMRAPFVNVRAGESP